MNKFTSQRCVMPQQKIELIFVFVLLSPPGDRLEGRPVDYSGG